MKLPNFFKNFYVVTALIFVIWIVFFDTNDLITQYYRLERYKTLEKEKKYHADKGKELIKNRQSISNNPVNMEKFAREKHLFKKPNEDVYIIVEEEKTKDKE